mmetsp:Transcript_8455/g.14189  ORF Transcript_8455/g.14189 Transcript_8455/m.14189 type:complete len:132 (+) Transcript_8455:1864-2259(+)
MREGDDLLLEDDFNENGKANLPDTEEMEEQMNVQDVSDDFNEAQMNQNFIQQPLSNSFTNGVTPSMVGQDPNAFMTPNQMGAYPQQVQNIGGSSQKVRSMIGGGAQNFQSKLRQPTSGVPKTHSGSQVQDY